MLYIVNLHDDIGNFGPARPLLYPLLQEQRLVEISPDASSLDEKLKKVCQELYNHIRYRMSASDELVFIVKLCHGNNDSKDKSIQFSRCLADMRYKIFNKIVKRLKEENIEFSQCYILAIDNCLHDHAEMWPTEEHARNRWELDCLGYTLHSSEIDNLFGNPDVEKVRQAWTKPQVVVRQSDLNVKELNPDKLKEFEKARDALLAVADEMLKGFTQSMSSNTHFLDGTLRTSIVDDFKGRVQAAFDGTAFGALNFDPVAEFEASVQSYLSVFMDIDGLPPVLRLPTDPGPMSIPALFQTVSLILALYESKKQMNKQEQGAVSQVHVDLDKEKLRDLFCTYYTDMSLLKVNIRQRISHGPELELGIRIEKDSPKAQLVEEPLELAVNKEPRKKVLSLSSSNFQRRFDNWTDSFQTCIEELTENALKQLEKARDRCNVPLASSPVPIRDIDREYTERQQQRDLRRDGLMREFKPWNPQNYWTQRKGALEREANSILRATPSSRRRFLLIMFATLSYLACFGVDYPHVAAFLKKQWGLSLPGTEYVLSIAFSAGIGFLLALMAWGLAFLSMKMRFKRIVGQMFEAFHETMSNIRKAYSSQIDYLNKYCESACALKDFDDIVALKKGYTREMILLKHHEILCQNHIDMSEQLHRGIVKGEPSKKEGVLDKSSRFDPSNPVEMNHAYQLVKGQGSEDFFPIDNFGSEEIGKSPYLFGIKRISIMEDSIYRKEIKR